MTDPTRADARISRFLLASNQFARSTGRVKTSAFLPPPSRRLSVFESTTASEGRIWELGTVHVASPRRKRLHARADLGAATILVESLAIEPAPPPPEHANVVGWPENDGSEEEIAIRLAKRARLVLNPTA